MSNSLDKLKKLTSRLEDKLEKRSTENISIVNSSEKITINTPTIESSNDNKIDCDNIRKENIYRVGKLYERLRIFEKSPDFDDIFIYKAMNLSGIGLKDEDFGEVREGKYIQIIAIQYEADNNDKKRAKNISLGYFGKGESLKDELKNEIIEFVLRWRYEKAFQNVEHYKDLLEKIDI